MVTPMTNQQLDELITFIENYECSQSKKNIALKARDLMIYQVLRFTGARIGEVLRMRIQDLDFYGERWIIPSENSKNGHAQEVYILPSLKASLEAFIMRFKDKMEEGHIFFRQKKGRFMHTGKAHLSHKCFRLQHRKYLKSMGMLQVRGFKKDGTPQYCYNIHSIRSTYAIQCYYKLIVPGKCSFLEVSKLLRHKHINSTIHYIQNLNLNEFEVQKKHLKEVFPQQVIR